jgi:hypothetical protein
MNSARTCDLEVVDLAAFRPGIARLVRRHFAVCVVPLNRTRDQCDCDQAWMGMPAIDSTLRIGRILNENR